MIRTGQQFFRDFFRETKRLRLLGVIVLIGTVFFAASDVSGQVSAPKQRQNAPSAGYRGRSTSGGGIPLPGRGAIPTPSALPSQQLASQAPQSSRGPQRESCLLRSARKVGSTDVIEIGLEGSGKLVQTILGEGGRESSDNVMELVAGFRYEERILDYEKGSGAPFLKSLRQYDQAGMKRNFQGNITRPLLDISRKNIVTLFDGQSVTLFSPSGPLKNDQFLLMSELPANSLLLDYLLPNREVKLGEEWTIPENILAPFLGLDSVEENTVRLVLTAIIDDMAEVDLFLTENKKDADGEPLPSSIQGASLGASVTMDIRGKYQFDLKAKRMTWFGMTVAEKRSESLVEPGLDWNGTIRVKIAPMDAPDELSDDKTKRLDIEPNEENMILVYNGQKGPWNFHHDRKWRMIEDGQMSAALTLIDRGEGIAQCNILSNGKIDLTTMPTLDSYKEELKKGLGDQFGQFVDASEYENEKGYHLLSVMVDGQFEELSFRRIYYLLTDPSGEQATVMFDIAANRLETFGDSGQEIVNSFTMILPKEDKGAKGKGSGGKTEDEGPAAEKGTGTDPSVDSDSAGQQRDDPDEFRYETAPKPE